MEKEAAITSLLRGFQLQDLHSDDRIGMLDVFDDYFTSNSTGDSEDSDEEEPHISTGWFDNKSSNVQHLPKVQAYKIAFIEVHTLR